MKIIWHSNAPFTNSAYGIQTALFVPKIASLGHDIIISSPHSFAGSPLDWNGFRIIPAAQDMVGNDIIASNYHYYHADLLITLCDVFKLIPSANQLAEINVAHWIPIDCDPMGIGDVTVLREDQAIPIAITQFGSRVMRQEGLDPLFVPHGIDTSIYKPGKRDEVRGSMDFSDDFIIGICAMNRDPVRKGMIEQLMAFQVFHERHPQSKLLIHSMSSSNPGMNFKALLYRLGLTADDVMFPDAYSLITGIISNEMMAAWYNGLDILSACSYAEGFGMPVLEAQACGVPVVTTDFSGTGELFRSGWLVKGEPYWIAGHESWWSRPSVADIADAYEAAWEARENGSITALSKTACESALEFDADRIAYEFWKPALERIEKEL